MIVRANVIQQGTKCKDFKLVCKLQSLGDAFTLQNLEKEIKSTNEEVNDILSFKFSVDQQSAYPIFMLFEIIHVQRITEFDNC